LVSGVDPSTLWPLGVYFACVVGVVAFMVGASFLLGQRHNDRATGEPYESGIVSEGSARLRMTSQFYLMAMLFVIFDLEAVFIFAWALAVRELGWIGYSAISMFIVFLLIALGYLWRAGALSWGPSKGGGTPLVSHGFGKAGEK
jgi:NADH-quinone oxidoreductase subunit A